MSLKEYTPWVEKYRPNEFSEIVLDDINKKILNNILKKNYFPNLLLYGPPGTGKTTTIINLVNQYQKINNEVNRELMIHLNASDERGIDVIRNQIYNFVNTDTLFTKGIKFVILDEVDYMTKNAQQALKYLLCGLNKNVRFCLICNYISRIDESLQNEFLRLRFNQLPREEIIKFLTKICENEKLSYSKEKLTMIHYQFKSDLRSMINYIQANCTSLADNNYMDNNMWEKLYLSIKNESLDKIKEEILYINLRYNIETKSLYKNLFNYIIRNKKDDVKKELLNFIEYVIHIQDVESYYFLNYSTLRLKELL